MQQANTRLHSFSMLVVAATLGLIFIGGLVTTRDAGMSVPDWPTTFHYSMFNVPFTKWISEDAINTGVFYEHSHRLFASLVGLLTTVMAVWLWKSEPRPWLRRLGLVAFLLVVAQGVLGGLRVTHSSIVLAMIHGCVAQGFLCVLVLISVALSPFWMRTEPSAGSSQLRGVCRTSWLLFAVVYTQLVVGAVMRHLKAGLAIPVFPQSGLNGEWIPTCWSTGVALNFSHRIGALLITLILIALLIQVFSSHGKERMIKKPARWLAFLVLVQIGLGACVILKLRPPTLTTLHVVNGAGILATTFLLATRASRLSSFGVGEENPGFSRSLRRAAA
jgi:cytochrome c oxidase assembly protein subunit 15